MKNNFGKIILSQKTGDERLTFNQSDTGLKLIDFWQWSVSDLISNATRGRFAEFIVANALNIDLSIIRDEWGPYDLDSPEGIKVEVKSAAYLQTWNQRDYSKINFSIKSSTFQNADTFKFSERMRHADVYVFCLLKHKDQSTLDPMILDQWEFYVVATTTLNSYTPEAGSISLSSLQKLATPVTYEQLGQTIRDRFNGR